MFRTLHQANTFDMHGVALGKEERFKARMVVMVQVVRCTCGVTKYQCGFPCGEQAVCGAPARGERKEIRAIERIPERRPCSAE